MKKTLTPFFIAAFLLFTGNAFAQWNQIGYMIVNGTDTVPDSHGFKGFGSNVYCPTDSGLFVSNDNGNSWLSLTDGKPVVNGQKMYSVLVAASGDIYAGSNRRLFKSTDNGATWSWLSTLPDSTLFYDIAETGGNIIVSFNKGASNGVYYSSNAGAGWTLATGISSSVRGFTVEGANVFLGGTANGVYKSTDNGQTWNILGTGFPASAGIWTIRHNGDGYFANSISGAGLFASYDNGATWNNTNPAVFNGFCQVFAVAEAGNMLIASMDGACNGGVPVKVSVDTGRTWNSFMAGLPAGFYSNLGRNEAGTSFFAKRGSTTGKAVYRYDMGTTGITQNAAPEIQFNLFPNPSSGAFSVSLQQNGSSAPELAIYDVLGKQVHVQRLANGTSTIITKDWPAGIYFYRLGDNAQLLRSGKIIVN